MTDIKIIRDNVISMLSAGLSPALIYHNTGHTLDVERQCLIIAKEEGITDEEALLELQIAALYHDTGLLFMNKGHEEKSCEIAKEQLPRFGLSNNCINNICEIILATKVPQFPKNHLQQIICDADLDYLGRKDYLVKNQDLCKEFLHYHLISNKDDWDSSRIIFLQSHAYFTKSSNQRRNIQKSVNLQQLKKLH